VRVSAIELTDGLAWRLNSESDGGDESSGDGVRTGLGLGVRGGSGVVLVSVFWDM
jgi:hypothetical protein